jgi:flagellar capping protein FliD
LAAPAANYVDYNSANNATYANGTYVSLGGTGGDPTTYWQALQVPTESPSTASTQWRQVIASVGRTMVDELGQNSIVRVNEGDKVYSNKTSFTDAEHGYEGITFDIAQMDVNDSASFVVARDSSQAKAAIDKLIEEFNDAQDYIKSLTSVTNDGERVTSGKFSSNIEISRLGSQLRKVVFGDSTPHSESGATSDGSNLIINARAGNSAELVAIANDLNFDSNNDGYIVKVLNDNASGNPKYWTYSAAGGGGAANWTETDPAYSSFRLSSIGLDFGIGSDRIMVKNSALLIQELEKNPDKVKALFSDARVESTKTADAADITATSPKTLTNNDPNSPTATNAVAGDTIANSAAFDANTSTYRPYQGISSAIDEFISAFLSGDSDSGYKGAYNTHIESIRSQNKRIDERIEDMERYLEQREKTLSDGFMRMEEMQSQLNTQLQTLQNSFKK